VYVGGNAVEIKTEVDNNDMTECPHDDQPTSGMLFSQNVNRKPYPSFFLVPV